jgi:hypothetical protein
MSRYYRWSITISGDITKDAQAAVETVLLDYFEDWTSYKRKDGTIRMAAEGEWNIGGGMPEVAMVRELREHIWEATEKYVEVGVGWKYLEDYDGWMDSNEEDYEEWVK